MVAIAVSAALFGICVTIYVNAGKFKRRSEQVLYISEEARGIFDRVARDLAGLHVASEADLADYWDLDAGGGRVKFLAATENPGSLDYCTVEYYVESGKLYRQLSADLGGAGSFPAKANSVLAEGIRKLTVGTDPESPAAGKVPRTVTITLELDDPGGRPGWRRFTVTLRPGSEED